MPIQNIIVIVLTFNSEDTIEEVVNSCRPLASRIVVVDSYSVDETVVRAERCGCEVVQHTFENYAAQRNWAQRYVQPLPGDWFLHVDSDEVVSPELAASIQRALAQPQTHIDGYLVRRLSYFLGTPIRYGHINPSWHLRLFRSDKGCCEDRLYDQHFVVPGETGKLNGLLIDLQKISLEKWTSAHNRWSTAEALEAIREQLHDKGEVAEGREGVKLHGSLKGDIRMKKRWMKNNVWYRLPLLARPLMFFIYTYFFRLGFLDGKNGLIYHFLQAFWFRFLVDAKIYERQHTHVEPPAN